MKVLLVAAPLEGRSGVYRSTYDLVNEARSLGLHWSAIIGMRASAPPRTAPETEGILEVDINSHGLSGVREIRGIVGNSPAFRDADVVVSLITQSDLAIASMGRQRRPLWVAYLRGLPWPAAGEQSAAKTVVQRLMERVALRGAEDVWVTTEVLADDVSLPDRPHLVPAGVPMSPREYFGDVGPDSRAVWAGRLAVDKQPQLFAEAVRLSGLPARMFGAGPLADEVRAHAPGNLQLMGWAAPDKLWTDAAMFVGTSYREAFGRSAVEAALRGIPVIVGSTYGAAPLLVRDPSLRRELVLSPDEPRRWAAAMTELWRNDDLRRSASRHVRESALELTIGVSVERMNERMQSLLRG